MTDLETMQRAKMYMDKLARGIDPITDQEVPEDSTLNHVRLARCFYYVSDVLGRVIANGGTVGQPVRNIEFSITAEQIAQARTMDYPVRITELTDALYRAVGNPQMKKPNTRKITDWLMEKGLMTQVTGADGKLHRVPTEQGLRMGMSTRLRQSRDGEYQAVYYDAGMQRFVMDHLHEMMMPGARRV